MSINFKNVSFQSFLVLSISYLMATDLLGKGPVINLQETPLGYYERRVLPRIQTVPRRHELVMTPAANQGPLGTCASFTVKSCGEYYYPGHLFSAAEFTILAETQLTWKESGDCTPGLFLGNALRIGKTYGLVDEAKLPYGDYLQYAALKSGRLVKDLAKKPLPTICIKDPRGGRASYNRTMEEMGTGLRLNGNMDDIGYTFSQLYPLHHVSHTALSLALQGIPSDEKFAIGLPGRANLILPVHALALGMPVAVGLPIFEGCWNSHVVKNPTQQHKFQGWHAVTLTGYDFDQQMFRLKNSWGVEWGHEGFGDIPFEYVQRYSSELVAVGNSY